MFRSNSFCDINQCAIRQNVKIIVEHLNICLLIIVPLKISSFFQQAIFAAQIECSLLVSKPLVSDDGLLPVKSMNTNYQKAKTFALDMCQRKLVFANIQFILQQNTSNYIKTTFYTLSKINKIMISTARVHRTKYTIF